MRLQDNFKKADLKFDIPFDMGLIGSKKRKAKILDFFFDIAICDVKKVLDKTIL